MEKRTLVSPSTNTKQVYKTALHMKPPKQVMGGNWNKRGGSGHPWPAPDLGGNAFRVSPRMMFAVGLSFIAFMMSGKVPSLTALWSVFTVSAELCQSFFFASETENVKSNRSLWAASHSHTRRGVLVYTPYVLWLTAGSLDSSVLWFLGGKAAFVGFGASTGLLSISYLGKHHKSYRLSPSTLLLRRELCRWT